MSSRVSVQEAAFVSTGWIYVLEMLLKIYAYGFENYWRDGQNRFDFIVTLVIGRLYSLLLLPLFTIQSSVPCVSISDAPI